MSLLALPASALAWLGRQGTRAVAISIFLGIAVPQLAATFKPYVAESIYAMLTLAFLRVDPRALLNLFARPQLVLISVLWTMGIVPVLLGGLFLWSGLDLSKPDLLMALVLQSAAPPVTSAPAFAALMGLEAALSLAVLVGCVIVTPLSAPLFASLFLNEQLAIAPTVLGLKLFAVLAGAALAAIVIRRIFGRAWVERQKERFDGLNVVLLFIFAVALMDGVASTLLTDPLLVLGLTALSFVISLGLVALTTLVFAPAGLARGFVLGLAVGHRNMGIMLAAVGSAMPELGWLYFAIAQFPIYLLPLILQPLARKMIRHES